MALNIKIFGLAFAFLSLFFVKPASAANLYISSDVDSSEVGDTSSVEVRINTENELINVVEGDIFIETGAQLIEIRELSEAGSNIMFWSRKPSLSEDKKLISFVGGVPGGLNQKDGLVFRIYFKNLKAGKVTFVPKNVKSYLNDGKGTLAKQSVKILNYSVLVQNSKTVTKDDWRKVVASDNMPPEFLSANIGQDTSMFDNKIFLSIYASDYQSGIERIEVKEGDLPFVRTGNDYVLRDQTKNSEVTINAYDNAGNVRTLVIKPSNARKYGPRVVIGFVLVLVMAISGFVILKLKKKVQPNENK